ncbi:STAS domain-containing protein [Actinomadura sp. NPDC048955]|uniref:STAS domain-containing protein n=1 Tax=Actinomadura sp. NPDC048955 TaxID=3158228 RepID=UPI0033EE5824
MDELTIELTTIPTVSTAQGQPITVLHLTGTLAFDTADHARDTLRVLGVLGSPALPPAHLIIDVERLLFLDMAGLRILLDLRRHSIAAGGHLAVAGGNDLVDFVLEVTALTDTFPRHPTITHAVDTAVDQAAVHSHPADGSTAN